MSPSLSIIIPIYNTEKYLSKCLDSIINQTYKDIEIICVNDGSPDNSLSILAEYQQKDKRIRIINQENAGLSAARNAGMKEARAPYVTFVDSDDFIELNTYELALPYFEDESVDLVYFSTKIVMEDNTSDYNQSYFIHKYTGKVQLSENIINSMDVCAWNKIYKLSIINKYNIRFPHGLLYEDNPFFWSYGLVSNSAYFIDDQLYNYLIRNGSIMSLTKEMKYKNNKNSLNGLNKLLGFEYLLQFMAHWNLFDRTRNVFSQIFEKNLYDALYYTHKSKRAKVLSQATDIVVKFNLDSYYPQNYFLTALLQRKYYKISSINALYLNKLQRLCGIWDTNRYYVICFLGLKIKLKK
ncbi:glycosyltransferase [Orbaceae bacterium ESL0727]|nr:glycosyltransferase [Orbaceae bacterium ESL0727]